MQQVEYKPFYIACRVPELRSRLQIIGVGVHGVVLAEGEVLIGRRSGQVGLYPGRYEFAPAGSLEGEDYKSHLLAELNEETGIFQEEVEQVIPFALAWSSDLPIVDLCAQLLLKSKPKQRYPAHPEYQEIRWVPWKAMPEFLQEHKNELVPMTQEIFAAVKR